VISISSGGFEYQLATEDCCFIENAVVTEGEALTNGGMGYDIY
jgi:hypothetical protein